MDYGAIVEEAKQRGQDYLQDQEGWKKSNKSNDVFTIETKPSKKFSCTVLRMTVSSPAPVKLCWDTIRMQPGTRRTEWDSDIREIKLIKDIDNKTILFFVHTNSVGKGVISPREFVDVARTAESKNEIISYGCGVDHPALESDGSKYVRAFNGCWFYKITKDPSNEGRTKMEVIVESEMKGWIPGALLSSTVPMVFSQALTNWGAFIEKETTK